MIVCVGEHFQISRHEPPEQFDPVHEVSASIRDRFVPSFGLLFYAFSIPKPADIDKVGGYKVKLLLLLPRARHRRQILKHKRDFVLTQKIGENRIKPSFGSYLDCEFVIRREFLQERCQDCNKIFLFRKLPSVKERKLKYQRP
jgi:hypothetical protein